MEAFLLKYKGRKLTTKRATSLKSLVRKFMHPLIDKYTKKDLNSVRVNSILAICKMAKKEGKKYIKRRIFRLPENPRGQRTPPPPHFFYRIPWKMSMPSRRGFFSRPKRVPRVRKPVRWSFSDYTEAKKQLKEGGNAGYERAINAIRKRSKGEVRVPSGRSYRGRDRTEYEEAMKQLEEGVREGYGRYRRGMDVTKDRNSELLRERELMELEKEKALRALKRRMKKKRSQSKQKKRRSKRASKKRRRSRKSRSRRKSRR